MISTEQHDEQSNRAARAQREAAGFGSAAAHDKSSLNDSLTLARALLASVSDGCAKAAKSRPRRALKKLQKLGLTLREADGFLFGTYTEPTTEREDTFRSVAVIHHHAYAMLGEAYVRLFDIDWTEKQSERAIDAATAALNCFKNALLVSFLAGNQVTNGFWLRTHHIFSHIANAPLNWTRKRTDVVDTVLSLYKHIMLLGIAQPHFLAPAEILALDRELKTLAPHSHILPAQMEWDRQHAFLIHTGQDSIPRRYSPARSFGDTQLWLLDTRDVVARCRLAQHAQNGSAATWTTGAIEPDNVTALTATKLEQLAIAWQAGERRKQPRQRKTMRLWLTFGLTRTFDALCAATQSILLGNAALNDSTAATRRAAIWRSTKPRAAAMHTFSTAGVGVLMQSTEHFHAPQIGDIVGIFADGVPGKQLGIAAVTWISPRSRGWWACGLQLLARNGVPLALQTHPDSGAQPCLLLPQRQARGSQPQLITGREYGAEEIVTLNDGRHAQTVQLGEDSSANREFACYSFTPYNAESSVASSRIEEQHDVTMPSNVTPFPRRVEIHTAR